MLKIICCITVFLIGCTVGFFKSNQYKKRLIELEACETLILRIKMSISAAKTPTVELFSDIAKASSMDCLPFVRRCSEGLLSDPDFPKVWRQAIDNSKLELSLKPDDYIPLYSLSELIGTYDANGILDGLELSKMLILESQKQARNEYEKNGRLSRSLGMLSGVAAAIMIV